MHKMWSSHGLVLIRTCCALPVIVSNKKYLTHAGLRLESWPSVVCRIVNQPFPLSIASPGYSPGNLAYFYQVIDDFLTRIRPLRLQLTLHAQLGCEPPLFSLHSLSLRAHGVSYSSNVHSALHGPVVRRAAAASA